MLFARFLKNIAVMKRLFLVLFIFAVLQANAEKNHSIFTRDTVNTALFGIYGIANIPTTQLEKSGYRPGGGAGIDWFSKCLISGSHQDLNLRLGFSLFYSSQGGVSNPVKLHEPLGAPGKQTLHNNLLGMDLRSRIIYDKHIVRPYLELFAGIRSYSTAQTLTINTPVQGYQSRTRTAELTSVVLSYGTSVGCLIKLSEDVFFDFKAFRTVSDSPVTFVDFDHMTSDGYMYKVNGPTVIPVMMSFQGGFVFNVQALGAAINSVTSCNYNDYSYSSGNYYYRSNRRSSSCHSSHHRSCGGKALR